MTNTFTDMDCLWCVSYYATVFLACTCICAESCVFILSSTYAFLADTEVLYETSKVRPVIVKDQMHVLSVVQKVLKMNLKVKICTFLSTLT